jgi:SHS2 domain-containing protein
MAQTPHRKVIYELIDHTADAGMWVFGRDHAELFAHAAWAQFDMISDAETICPRQSVTIAIDGAADWEDLLVRWLGELLYHYDTQRFLCCSASLTTLSPTRLTAQVQGEPFDPARHPIDTEIKAVTYHQVTVEPCDTGWRARVIFDV